MNPASTELFMYVFAVLEDDLLFIGDGDFRKLIWPFYDAYCEEFSLKKQYREHGDPFPPEDYVPRPARIDFYARKEENAEFTNFSLLLFRYHELLIAEFDIVPKPDKIQTREDAQDFWNAQRRLLQKAETIAQTVIEKDVTLRTGTEARIFKKILGASYVYFAQGDEQSVNDLTPIAKGLKLGQDIRITTSDFPGCGTLADIVTSSHNVLESERSSEEKTFKSHYVLFYDNISQRKGVVHFFLDFLFPFLENYRQKLRFQREELEKIKLQNVDNLAKLKNVVILPKEDHEDADDGNEGPKARQKRLEKMKGYQHTLWENLGKMRKIDHTLEINMDNLREAVEWMPQLLNDPSLSSCDEFVSRDHVFAPLLQRVARDRQQLAHDVEYLRITLETHDRYIKTLELEIDSIREDQERRIEHLIAALGIALAVGQIIQQDLLLKTKVLSMLISFVLAYLFVPLFVKALDGFSNWVKNTFGKLLKR